MPTLTAAQHFFTSVPAEQSPTRRRGYQTLFFTPGLSQEVVRAIEDRAQYTTGATDPLKCQYYPLPGDLFAISQSIALAELDEFGRKGRYLSHTLLLDRRTLNSLGGCPLDIFRQFSFATQLEQVFRLGQTGNLAVPAINLEIRLDWPQAALQVGRAWSRNQWEQLGRLAWQAPSLLEKRQNIALFGTTEQQLAFLSLLFWLASPPQRSSLSFDTYANGCQYPPGVVFWTSGYPERSEGRPLVQVDLINQRIEGSLSPAEDDHYAKWMVRQGLEGDLQDLARRQTWAAMLDQILVPGQKPTTRVDFRSIPADFLRKYAAINQAAILRRWFADLPAGLSAELSQRIEARLLHDLMASFFSLLQGLQPQKVQEFMLQELLAMGSSPSKVDRQVLGRWIPSTGNLILESLLPLWERDERGWAKALQKLDAGTYRNLLLQLSQWRDLPLPVWQALVESHGEDWIYSAGLHLPADEWKKALPQIEKLDEALLEELVSILPQLSVEARNVITGWLKGAKSPAPKLRQALGLPIIEAGQPKKRFRLF